MVKPEQVNEDLARRYVWFCTVGWKEPTLNHPSVILGKATPADIDTLIRKGMKCWPLKEQSPLEAA